MTDHTLPPPGDPDPAGSPRLPGPDGEPEFSIRPLEDGDLDEALALLDDTFGDGHDRAWFSWKHRSGPAGSSPGLVAVDDDGILGLRLLLPWSLALDELPVDAVRPVDTVVAPRGRRRGVFSRLTAQAISDLERSKAADLIFNTPNEQSRPGYARLGWTVLDPLPQSMGAIPPLGRAVVRTDVEPVTAALGTAVPGRFTTRRSPEFLRWRYDPRSGHDYAFASLPSSDHPNGLVYRVTSHRLGRMLVVCELAGSAGDRRRLVASVARAERAFAWLGLARAVPLPRVRRGVSHVAVRPMKPMSPDPTTIASWELSLGDLEGII